MYTFKIANDKGECTTFEHIEKVTYSIPALDGSKETVIEGDEIFNHRYQTSYDLHLFSKTEAFTVSKRKISIIQVIKEI